MPSKLENVESLLTELVNVCIENTRHSSNYDCVFRFNLDNFFLKSSPTHSHLDGIDVMKMAPCCCLIFDLQTLKCCIVSLYSV